MVSAQERRIRLFQNFGMDKTGWKDRRFPVSFRLLARTKELPSSRERAPVCRVRLRRVEHDAPRVFEPSNRFHDCSCDLTCSMSTT